MQRGTVRKVGLLLGLVAFVSFLGGCKKRVAGQPPARTPAPPAAQPTVTLNASPQSVASHLYCYYFMAHAL